MHANQDSGRVTIALPIQKGMTSELLGWKSEANTVRSIIENEKRKTGRDFIVRRRQRREARHFKGPSKGLGDR